MDAKALLGFVSELIREKNFVRAEELLLEANRKGQTEGDAQTRSYVLSELIELYCILDPPQLAKAEALSVERERLNPSAYSVLQTAMILHHGARDYARGVPKLEEAISQGRTERDDRTVYTALGLLGQASLGLGRTDQALQVLGELKKWWRTRASSLLETKPAFWKSFESNGSSQSASPVLPLHWLLPVGIWHSARDCWIWRANSWLEAKEAGGNGTGS